MPRHTTISQHATQQVYIIKKLKKINSLLIFSLLCAKHIDDDDMVVGDNVRSRVWAVCGGSNAIGLSYGQIGIVLLLGFRDGIKECNQTLAARRQFWVPIDGCFDGFLGTVRSSSQI